MLKYLAKISMDIFPSVLATIIGAYIVNHYINAKPAADAPAAVAAPADGGKVSKPADIANLPGPGVKAKGIPEKSVSDRAAANHPTDTKAADTKAADTKAADTKAADLAPAETVAHGRNAPARDKAAAKSTPAVTPSPVVEASSAPASAAATPDANDLARAAIERLRKSPESKAAETKPIERGSEPAIQEAARLPESPRVITAAPPAVRPLPPPITVATPPAETYAGSTSIPPYTSSVESRDPNRITPPADIPVPVIAPPLDLRADAGATMPRPKTNVADEMLSGVKSMFHAVLPKGASPD